MIGGLSILFMEISGLLFVIALGLFLGIALISLTEKDKKSFDFLLFLFVSIFLFRILLATLFYNQNYMRSGYGFRDDSFSYSENAYKVAQIWEKGIRNINLIRSYVYITGSRTGTDISNYEFWNAFILILLGKSPVILAFVNCMFSSLTVIFIYLITRQLSNRDAARYAAVLTALWPSLIFWSIQNLKDPLTTFLICALILFFISLRKRFRFYYLFLIIVFSVALKFVRGQIFIVFYAVVVPASLFFYFRIYKLKKEILIFFGIIFILLCILNFFSIAENFRSHLGGIYDLRLRRTFGNLALFENINLANRNPELLLNYLPLFFLAALFAPFPWQVANISQIMAVPETLFFYFFFRYLIKGGWFVIKNKAEEGGIVIVFILAMYSMLALVEGNAGTLFRHRAMVIPLVISLISVGKNLSKESS